MMSCTIRLHSTCQSDVLRMKVGGISKANPDGPPGPIRQHAHNAHSALLTFLSVLASDRLASVYPGLVTK